MIKLLSGFFSPLTSESCIYFLILTIFFFVMIAFALVADVVFIIKNYKILNYRHIQGGVLILFNLFIAYFVNRLLYTMCVKSII